MSVLAVARGDESAEAGIGSKLRGAFISQLIFLGLMLVLLKSTKGTPAVFTLVELSLSLVLFVSLLHAKPANRLVVFLAFLPMAGFPVPPRRLGISLLLVALALIVYLASKKVRLQNIAEVWRSSLNPAIRLYAFWFAIWFALSLFGVDVLNSFYRITLLLLFLPIIAIALEQARIQQIGPDQLWVGIKTALWISIVFTLFQLVFGLDFKFGVTLNVNVLYDYGGVARYPGPFADALGFSQFLSVLLLFCLLFTPSQFDMGRILVGILGFLVLLLNGSRTAPIGAVLGVILVGLIRPRSRVKVVVRILVVVAILLIISLLVDLENLSIVRRLVFIRFSAAQRIAIWLRSFRIFLAYPWAGIGFENFSQVVLKFDPTAIWKNEAGARAFTNPESMYLKFLIETGIIGFIAFLTVIVRTVKQYIGALRDRSLDEQTSSFIAASFSAYVCILVGQFTVYTMVDPRILFFFGFCTIVPFVYWRPRPTKTKSGMSS